MNLISWFVLGLISFLFFSFPLNSRAFQVKIDEDTFANIQAQIRVFYINKDEDNRWKPAGYSTRANFDYRTNYFEIYKFRFGIKGQLNNLVSFYTFIDANENNNYQAKLWEGDVQFNFRPEFIVKVGKIRVPFSRHNFVARHNSPVMSSDGDYFLPNQFKESLKAVNPYAGGMKSSQPFKRTDVGMVIAGSFKDGLFKYYVGIFNEDKSNSTKVWSLNGGFGDVATVSSPEDKKSFEYDIRLEFTPTFWGFKSEKTVFNPSQRVNQTYLGKIDTMTFGIGYHREKHLEHIDKSTYGISSLTREAYAVDFSFEKTFKQKYIIGAEAGYMYFDDTHLYETASGKYEKGDAYTWYGEAHIIYNQKIGFGIPGVGFRYEYVNVDGEYNNEKDLIYRRYGVCLSYYYAGRTNRIGIGFDYVDADDALEAYIKDNNWEESTFTWYVGIYAKF
ncbi:MAG: hypothetical protein OD816_000188 [Thermodesulfobacterium sp.]|uniref:Phosphate-selective porin O and P n=1 Tax=Candidatus Thermodesulfobacterium syntrophicum TaxID=3060442 RepID=A0AAE3P306_9BACT|nr:hypothetical protein [Candidatus Thermodesulfobacterium syntrophicum]